MTARNLQRWRYNMRKGRECHLAAMQSLLAKNPDNEACVRNQIYSASYYMTARAIRESYSQPAGQFASSNLCRKGIICA